MQRREIVFITLSGVLLLLIYHVTFHSFFPNQHGFLGHDYGLFLPKLLDGYFWYHHNGLFAVPWFTPGFCGGIPLLPDPQSLYYSLPQFLTFVMNPLTGVYVTFLVFAGLGFLGFYVLLRRVFGTGPWAALLGSGLFLFNGFYAHRIIIGHLTYHPFMLIPWVAFFLLRPLPVPPHDRRVRLAFDGIMAGLALAYMFQSGMVNVALPALVSIVLLDLIYGILRGEPQRFWTRLVLAGGVSLGLSSAKLVAGLAYLRNFARDTYPLPGTERLVDAAAMVLRSLFVGPTHEFAEHVFVNGVWKLGRHEFEFSVTVVPLLLVIIGALSWIHQARTQAEPPVLEPKQWLRLAMALVLLSLPIVLNYHTPGWHTVLKQLPILKNSSTLIRWVSLYIPVVIVLAGLSVEHARLLRHHQSLVVSLGLFAVVVLTGQADRTYYHNERFKPGPVLATYDEVRHGQWRPAIEEVTLLATRKTSDGTTFIGGNSVVARGGSQLICYEPLFGYRLEAFRVKSLRAGPVMRILEGVFNLKNPACYVYPQANGCRPGDHFSVAQQEAAEAFVHYRPFPFRMPVWQEAANRINLATLFGVPVFLIGYGLWRCRRPRAKGTGEHRRPEEPETAPRLTRV